MVDYKTGRTPSTTDDARSSVALSVYAAGAETVFHRRCVRVELHHLPTTTVVAWESSPEWIARHLGRLDSLCTELQAADDTARSGIAPEAADELFPANVGPLCGWCDFRESCAEGSSVPRRPSWAGVVERGEESSAGSGQRRPSDWAFAISPVGTYRANAAMALYRFPGMLVRLPLA